MTAARYFDLANQDGRAVLLYASTPSERGTAQPRAWIVRIGSALILCTDDGGEESMLQRIDPTLSIGAARVHARRHWHDMLYSRREARRHRQRRRVS